MGGAVQPPGNDRVNPMNYRSTLFFATALAVGAAGAAQAGPKADFARKLFDGGLSANDKSYACFVRHYAAAHLASHPEQKVSVMKLLVTGEGKPADEDELKEKGPLVNYSFRLGLRFRTRAGNFDSSGYCGHPVANEQAPDKLQLNCGVDCDGGGISIELANNDRSTLIRLDRIRIWQNNNPDDEGADLSGGADDRVFRLDRARLEECRSLITDREELAAVRRKK